MIIVIDGIQIELLRKPIKSFNLRIYPPDGLVKASVPLKYSDKLIRQLIQNKSTWIRAQQECIKNRPIQNIQPLQTGISLPFMGKDYCLIISEHNGPSKVKISESMIHLYTNPDSSELTKQLIIDRWYKKEMTAILPELFTQWEQIIGVKANDWGIKKMKTRWGSCNTRARRIWLNLNLIKKPLICLEYVLVHELVHLLEASHNHRFHALMTQFMPQWREYECILEPQKRKRKRTPEFA